jgi:hypothetical protein
VAEIIDRWDPNAFVTVEEPRILRGGSVAGRTRIYIPFVWERAGRQSV